MGYYKKHIFFCLNQRTGEKKCCYSNETEHLFLYAKQYLKQIDTEKRLKTRINKAGCLGRCQEGPLLVIYPDGIWYQFKNENDIQEIIEETIVKGKVVTRLLLKEKEEE